MRLDRLSVGFGVLAWSMVASASVVIPVTIEQLSQKAAVVVRARVGEQHVDRTRGGRIVTTTTLQVTKRLKGDSVPTVRVRTLGGVIGGVGQQVSGEAHFAAGEEVLVFLRPTGLTDGSFAVIGMAQGKFSISKTAAGVVALQDLSGLGFASAPGAPIADRSATPIAAEELEARVVRAGAP